MNPIHIDQIFMNSLRANISVALKYYDYDQVGKMDRNELTHVIEQSGLSQKMASEMARHIFDELETNRDQTIPLADIQNLVSPQKPATVSPVGTFLMAPAQWPNWFVYMQNNDEGNVRGSVGLPDQQGELIFKPHPQHEDLWLISTQMWPTMHRII